MAFVLPDRTRETLASAPGTGNVTTAGATQGAQSIASSLTSNGDTTWATIDNGTAWETNTITRVSAGVYSRGTPFASSNSNALVNFASGTLEIFPDVPGSKAKVLERLAWSAGAILSVGDGTVSLPAWSFSNDPDCGLYRIGANNLGIAVNGAKVLDVGTAGLGVTGLMDLSAASSGQISFPATQNASAGANTLDDYEEGTFTPDVKNTSSSSTWSVKSGFYRKIAGHVGFWGLCSTGNSGTAGSLLIFSGFPFAVAALSGSHIIASVNAASITGANLLSGGELVIQAATQTSQLTFVAFHGSYPAA